MTNNYIDEIKRKNRIKRPCHQNLSGAVFCNPMECGPACHASSMSFKLTPTLQTEAKEIKSKHSKINYKTLLNLIPKSCAAF